MSWAAAGIAVLMTPALFADPVSELQARLVAELADQVFEINGPIGSSWLDPTVRVRSFNRPVDTEIDEDGNYAYVVRKLPLLSRRPGNFYLPAEEVSVMLPRGSKVLVEKVEVKKDRVELHLESLPAGRYGKIKLLQGNGLSARTFPSVMESLGRVLNLQRFKRKQELEALREAARRRLADAADALARRNAARDLRRALTELAEDENTLTQVLAEEIRELDRSILELEPQARRLAIARIHAQLEAEAREESALKMSLQRNAPIDQSRMLDRWEAILHKRVELGKDLTALGETPPVITADVSGLGEISRLRAALVRERGKVERERLDAEYEELARKRHALVDAYTKQYASPGEAAAIHSLVEHLKQMIANREHAAKLGSPVASRHATDLSRELKTFERKMH